MSARRGAWIAGSAAALCVAILFADYLAAARRAPVDAGQILNLQQQTKTDASLAPKLAAEHKRITAARQARRSRDNVVAWLLIATAAVFLTCIKALVGRAPGPRLPPKPPRAEQRPRCSNRLPKADEIDLAFVDAAIAKLGRSREAAIPLLQAIQNHYRYLPDEALRRICELTEITAAEIAGTSSFYARFRRSPVGQHVVRVCHGTACHVSGARQITDELRRYLAIPDGADTDPARLFTLDEVACLGCCSLAPVLMVDAHPAGKLTPATACDALQVFEPDREPA